jgi:NAD(P)H-flavin reductase
VREVRAVAPDVAVVLLEPSGDLPFRPGQYLDVFHPSGPSRSYSIASLPAWGLLELHVRRIPDGLLSTWLHGLEAGAQLEVRGAFGQCFYTPDEEGERPDKLLLVGAGTGLAPLLGIARDAVAQGYGGQIDLVHGGLEPSRLYLRDELRAFERQAAALTVHHCVLHGATSDEISGSLEDVAAAVGAPLGKSRAFLCGDEGIVRVLQRSLFLAGVPSGEILADPFSPASTG